MVLPGELQEPLADVLRGIGSGPIKTVTPVRGGCINNGARLDTEDRRSYFLKWNATAAPGLFEAEVDGLRALRDATSLPVPEVITHGGEQSSAWLLMEWIEPGHPGPGYGRLLGEGLAELHGPPQPHGPGWPRDNWIGSLPQSNAPAPSWGAFWRDRRIVPQLERARSQGYLRSSALDRVVDLIPDALADLDGVSLLHGDLWSGNAFADRVGRPVLIDPAVYRGHGEVDLAMTELFAGFPRAMYAAYRTIRGIPEEYYIYRRDLYQLYYLLVHVNLFGRSYEGQTMEAVRRVVGRLG